MGLLGAVWDLFFWIIGLICLGIAVGVGFFASNLIYGIIYGIGESVSFKLPSIFVDLPIRAVVWIGALILCIVAHIPFSDVWASFWSFGNFDELILQFGNGTQGYILNDTISVAWNQLILTFIFFQPYFLITEGITLIKALFCDPEDELGYDYVLYFFELLTLLATTAVVIFLGDGLAYIALEFIQTTKIKFGLIRFLWRLVLFCIYMYRVVCDLLGSDVFISMFAANVAAVLLGVDLTGSAHTIILVLSIVIGYLSKLGRKITGLLNQNQITEIYGIGYGLVSGGILVVLFVIVMKLLGV
ncbi:MAG: hypothetical protein E7192_03750 [Erysipelotrichaceae bacterium]|nr:hypothetical protein [Erysipelotrichaceae bacterium]